MRQRHFETRMFQAIDDLRERIARPTRNDLEANFN
jgi:hypothetical protein